MRILSTTCDKPNRLFYLYDTFVDQYIKVAGEYFIVLFETCIIYDVQILLLLIKLFRILARHTMTQSERIRSTKTAITTEKFMIFEEGFAETAKIILEVHVVRFQRRFYLLMGRKMKLILDGTMSMVSTKK